MAWSMSRARTNGNERHHLFDTDEGMMLVRFTEDQFDRGRHVDAGRLGQERRVLSDKVLAGGVVLVIANLDDRLAGQLRDLCGVEFDRHRRVASPPSCRRRRCRRRRLLSRRCRASCCRTRPLDDAACRVVQIGGLIDDDRRISGTGNDCSLAASQCRAADRRSTGDADQSDVAMFEQRLGRFQVSVRQSRKSGCRFRFRERSPH